MSNRSVADISLFAAGLAAKAARDSADEQTIARELVDARQLARERLTRDAKTADRKADRIAKQELAPLEADLSAASQRLDAARRQLEQIQTDRAHVEADYQDGIQRGYGVHTLADAKLRLSVYDDLLPPIVARLQASEADVQRLSADHVECQERVDRLRNRAAECKAKAKSDDPLAGAAFWRNRYHEMLAAPMFVDVFSRNYPETVQRAQVGDPAAARDLCVLIMQQAALSHPGLDAERIARESCRDLDIDTDRLTLLSTLGALEPERTNASQINAVATAGVLHWWRTANRPGAS